MPHRKRRTQQVSVIILIFAFAVASLAQDNQLPTDTAAQKVLWPKEVTLVTNVTVRLISGSGAVVTAIIKKGQTLPVVNVASNKVVVMFAGKQQGLQFKATDIEERIAALVPKREMNKRSDASKGETKPVSIDDAFAPYRAQREAEQSKPEYIYEHRVKGRYYLSSDGKQALPVFQLAGKILQVVEKKQFF